MQRCSWQTQPCATCISVGVSLPFWVPVWVMGMWEGHKTSSGLKSLFSLCLKQAFMLFATVYTQQAHEIPSQPSSSPWEQLGPTWPKQLADLEPASGCGHGCVRKDQAGPSPQQVMMLSYWRVLYRDLATLFLLFHVWEADMTKLVENSKKETHG